MTQSHVLELAKQGDPQAIATLMNQSLQPRGMSANVERQGDVLEVVLEAERVPNRDALTAFVEKGISNLGVESIKFIRILGQQTGATFPAWMQELNLAIAEPDVAPELDAVSSIHVDESIAVDPTVPPALMNGDLSDPDVEELGALTSSTDAISIPDQDALPESLPDEPLLEIQDLAFADSLQELPPDIQQRELEAQLENLWAQPQDLSEGEDFDLAIAPSAPISEAEFQDLFAEEEPSSAASTDLGDLFIEEPSSADFFAEESGQESSLIQPPEGQPLEETSLSDLFADSSEETLLSGEAPDQAELDLLSLDVSALGSEPLSQPESDASEFFVDTASFTDETAGASTDSDFDFFADPPSKAVAGPDLFADSTAEPDLFGDTNPSLEFPGLIETPDTTESLSDLFDEETPAQPPSEDLLLTEDLLTTDDSANFFAETPTEPPLEEDLLLTEDLLVDDSADFFAETPAQPPSEDLLLTEDLLTTDDSADFFAETPTEPPLEEDLLLTEDLLTTDDSADFFAETPTESPSEDLLLTEDLLTTDDSADFFAETPTEPPSEDLLLTEDLLVDDSADFFAETPTEPPSEDLLLTEDLLVDDSADFFAETPTESPSEDLLLTEDLLTTDDSADFFTETPTESPLEEDLLLTEDSLSADFPAEDTLSQDNAPVESVDSDLNQLFLEESGLTDSTDGPDDFFASETSAVEPTPDWRSETPSQLDTELNSLDLDTDFFAASNEEMDLDLLDETDVEPVVAPPPYGFADGLEGAGDDLFVEDLRGITEEPIEYVFGSETTADEETVDAEGANWLASETGTETGSDSADLSPALLEAQLDNLWAEEPEAPSFDFEEEPLDLGEDASNESIADLLMEPSADFSLDETATSTPAVDNADFLIEPPADSTADDWQLGQASEEGRFSNEDDALDLSLDDAFLSEPISEPMPGPIDEPGLDFLEEQSDTADRMLVPDDLLLDLPAESPSQMADEDISLEFDSEGFFTEDQPDTLSNESVDASLDETLASLDLTSPESDLGDRPVDDENDLFLASTDPTETAANVDDLSFDLTDDFSNHSANGLSDSFSATEEADLGNLEADLPAEFLQEDEEPEFPLGQTLDDFSDQPSDEMAIPSDNLSADLSDPLLDPSAALDLDLLDEVPDEPLANLVHESTKDDLGIDFLNEPADESMPLEDFSFDEMLVEETPQASSPEASLGESFGETLPGEALPDELPSDDMRLPESDTDLDLPLNFLDSSGAIATTGGFDQGLEEDDEFSLPSDLLEHPDLLEQPADPLANLFSDASTESIADPFDHQPSSMEEVLPPQFRPSAEEAPLEVPVEFLNDDLDQEANSLFLEDHSSDDLADLSDPAIDFSQEPDITEASAQPGELEEPMMNFPDQDFSDQGNEAVSSGEYPADDLDEEIGNLSLGLDPEVYTDEDTSIAASQSYPDAEPYRSDEAAPDWDTAPDWSSSTELSQEQLEAQLEDFDRNSTIVNGYEPNGQSRPSTSTLVEPKGGASWLFPVILLSVSGLVAGLLGYSIWSEVAAPPSAPQPSVSPAPNSPPTVPSAPASP